MLRPKVKILQIAVQRSDRRSNPKREIANILNQNNIFLHPQLWVPCGISFVPLVVYFSLIFTTKYTCSTTVRPQVGPEKRNSQHPKPKNIILHPPLCVLCGIYFVPLVFHFSAIYHKGFSQSSLAVQRSDRRSDPKREIANILSRKNIIPHPQSCVPYDISFVHIVIYFSLILPLSSQGFFTKFTKLNLKKSIKPPIFQIIV